MGQKLPKPLLSFGVPIYGGMVLFYRKPKTFKRAFDAIGGDDMDDNVAGYCVAAGDDDGHVIYLIGVFDGLRSTMAHEAGHLAMQVLVRAGMDPRDSGGEAYCYLLGTLLDQLGIDK